MTVNQAKLVNGKSSFTPEAFTSLDVTSDELLAA
jgi:hypothetical protein